MTPAPMTLVSVPAGSVTVRDARRAQSRTVVLEPFEIAALTVSDGEHQGGVTWFEAMRWCNLASDEAGLTRAYEQQESLVAWDPAADGYRLPTVAEWEHACRAGTEGPTYGPLDAIAWTAADAVQGPQRPGQKLPNALGLFDTIGNLWEWCWDYADPARYADYRTLKGGGWADQAWSCRVGARRASAPDARLEDVGFRVARGAVVGRDGEFQGWSAQRDRERAGIRGPLPMGWTPLRELAR